MATLLLRGLPPPTPSSCSGSDAPMAPISAWSRAASPSGSHSRRKNGPREVPARMRTQGMILFISHSGKSGVAREVHHLDRLMHQAQLWRRRTVGRRVPAARPALRLLLALAGHLLLQ